MDTPIPSRLLVAQWLEDYRRKLRKNKTNFSGFLGTSPENYQHICHGRSYPTFEILARLNYHGWDIFRMFQDGGK